MAAGCSVGALSLQVAQYAPRERVSRKPRTPRRSVIIVSAIVGPPQRLHSIAMSRLRLLFNPAIVKRRDERIKNDNGASQSETATHFRGQATRALVSIILTLGVPHAGEMSDLCNGQLPQ
jgi:hypothetical protein